MGRVISALTLLRNAPVFRRGLAVAVIVSCVAFASLLVYAARTRTARGAYGPADDCPRGALVYAQVSDLPALLRLWDESNLKERYLASTNFRQFQSGHVALKLVRRFQEFDAALGFTLDAAALAGATEQKAAVAVYDIGRMELVFVAPVDTEKALAARFFQDADRFEKTELPDGTVYYSSNVEADRGRQKQKILFAFVKGRFVLATGEQLMLRTLANVNGKSRTDRLSDEPSFRTLSGGVSPHFATVWVDQSKLNGDYYFKHYWLMGDAALLSGMRAGIFDFEMREGSWLERREYLVQNGKQRQSAALSAQALQDFGGAIPPEAAYVRLRVLGDGGAAALVRNVLLDRLPEEKEASGTRLHEEFDPVSEESDDYSSGGDYLYLDSDYDEAIDDSSDAEEDGEGNASVSEERSGAELDRVLRQARPTEGAAAAGPLTHDGPLFVEFRRLVILRLENQDGLDRQALERAIGSLVLGRLTVTGKGDASLNWADGGGASRRWRELELPMLGWKLCYALKDGELFVSNDTAFLEAALVGGGGARRPDVRFAPDDVTLIRLDHKGQAFDQVFGKLDAQRVSDYWKSRDGGAAGSRSPASEEFFSGNVASLLDVASSVSRVEIRRRSTADRLHVEVEMVMSGGAQGENAR
jgi:hypothetical protein